jgi:hypothetical protein
MIDKSKIKWGYKRDKPDKRDYKLKVTPLQVVTLPPTVILPDPTGVRNQGSLGCCGGFAGDENFKLRDFLATGTYFDGAPLAIYYWARELDGNVNDDAGTYLRTVAKVLATKGVPPETDWPYIESKFAVKPPANVEADAAKCTAKQYYRVDGSTPQETLTNIKVALASQYPVTTAFNKAMPVMFGFDVFNNFFNISNDGNMPMGAGGLAGGHAVDVQGYVDSHKNLDGSLGALLIKNSWGRTWGCQADGSVSNGTNGGYFFMPYNYVLKSNNNVGDAWIVVEESTFVNPPTPTPTPVPPTPTPTPTPTPNPVDSIDSIIMTHKKSSKNTVAIWVSAKDKRGNKLVGATIKLVDQNLTTDSTGKASFKIVG